MRRRTAELILQLMRDVSGELNNSIFAVLESAEPDEAESYKMAIGRVMGEILVEIMHPILDQYPDLAPSIFDKIPDPPESAFTPPEDRRWADPDDGEDRK